MKEKEEAAAQEIGQEMQDDIVEGKVHDEL